MKTILIIMSLFCFEALAANGSGNVSSVSVIGGARETNNPITMPLGAINSNFYAVTSAGNNGGNSTAGNFYGFGKQKGTAGQWKVASGKIATCVQMYFCSGAAEAAAVQLGYATATFTNNTASGSPPTGATCFSPNGNCTNISDGRWRFNTANSNVSLAYNYNVTFDASATGANADIYPFVRTDGTTTLNLVMICYEQ